MLKEATYSHKFNFWIKLSSSFLQYLVKMFCIITPENIKKKDINTNRIQKITTIKERKKKDNILY